MTFCDGLSPLQSVVDRKQTFGEWASKNIERFFLPKREPNYSLESIVHFFMKRLHQPYEQIMRMDEEKRDKIFTLEKSIQDKENAKHK